MDFKIGIFGGTFNPPHYGHQFLVKTIAEEFSLNEVLILPVGCPPHKKGIMIAKKEARAEMLHLLFDEFSFAKICRLELDREGYTYPVDTLRALKAMYPENTSFYYIIGSDTLFELENWKNPSQVFSLTNFISLTRPGDSLVSIKEKAEEYRRLYHASISFSAYLGPNISSTEIRNAIKNHADTTAWIPNTIREYIDKNHVFND